MSEKAKGPVPTSKNSVSPRREHDFYKTAFFVLGRPWKPLGTPWTGLGDALGSPQGRLGGPWRRLGRPLGLPWGTSLEELWIFLGGSSLEGRLGSPRGTLGGGPANALNLIFF